MRFHVKFTRNKGTTDTLGTDTVPTGKPPVGKDNVLSANVKASWGTPVHRIAVIYIPPSGTQVLDGDLYLFDGLTDSWHKLAGGGTGAIKPGEVVYFDLPAISDRIIKPSDADSPNHAAGFDVALIVSGHVDAGAGDHVFAMAAITSLKGI